MVKNTEVNLSTVSRDLKKSPSDAVVIGVGQGTDGPVLLENPLTAKSAEALADSLKALGVTGAADQLVRLPGLPETGAGILVLAGVGKVPAAGALTGEALRRAAGSAVRQLAGLATVTLAFPTAGVQDVAAVAEGAALGAYSFAEFRSSTDGLKDPVRAAQAFASAVDATVKEYGRYDIPWGDIHRVRMGNVDVPVGGCAGALGCFRVLNFKTDADGKREAFGGDGWVLAVEFGDQPRAYSVLAYGESDIAGNPHDTDQAEMFAKGEMKRVLFQPKDVDAAVIKRYRPGAKE